MERLTEHRGKGTIIVDMGKHYESAIRRLAAIEDILGDEYDLDRLRLLLENDKSCYTCKNYKGGKICGFKRLDVEINPQEGCSVREAALQREQDGE